MWPIRWRWKSEAWPVTKTLAWRLNAFDSWSLRKILRIPLYQTRYQRYCQAVSCLIERDGSASLSMWHVLTFNRITIWLFEALLRPHWRGPSDRPRSTCLRGISFDVQSVNIGIHSAWRKKQWLYTLAMHRRHGNTPSRGTPLKRERETEREMTPLLIIICNLQGHSAIACIFRCAFS